MPKSRYSNVEYVPAQKYAPGHRVEKNAALPKGKPREEESHIDELIVTGRGHEAFEAIESVKHRVDEKTSILLMNEGMGVLEDVREEVFKDAEKEPKFILGHMSHSLHYNRKFDSVQQLKSGKTLLTEVPGRRDGLLSLEPRMPMLETMQQLGRLRVTSTTYDDWLRFKLPSMIFTAVVEPVCVVLDLTYKGLLENKAAQGMIKELLNEIILLVQNFPEVQESAQILAYLQSSSIQKMCYKKILAKASAPSDLQVRVSKGLGTDINYQNGYFLRRAKKLNLDMPMNSFMAKAVKAKSEEHIARRNAYIPVVEKSHAPADSKANRKRFHM